MAEIKSTLDIIMERTKNLTMTKEEKASFYRKEAEGKARGWIQRYQDGLVDLDKLKSDFEKELAADPEFRPVLRSQVLDSLKLGADNSRLLRVIRDILGAGTEDIENTIESFRREMEALRIKRIAAIAKDLKKKKISGSAVVPNPDRNSALQEALIKAESELKERLKSVPASG
jgi:hypothetical protein